MRPDTFDIPAYKFALVRIGNGRIPKNIGQDERIGILRNEMEGFGKTLGLSRIQIIPFENVDGLTCEEVGNVLRTDYDEIIFVCYYGGVPAVANSMNIFLSLYIQEDEENKNKPIDKIIEEIFEEMYSDADDKEKQVIRCFFERYQDKNHQETQSRIKKIRR